MSIGEIVSLLTLGAVLPYIVTAAIDFVARTRCQCRGPRANVSV